MSGQHALCRMVGRQLKRWEPSADDAPLEGLEDARGSGGGHGSWDQFALNRSKFGVQTTFQVGLQCGPGVHSLTGLPLAGFVELQTLTPD